MGNFLPLGRGAVPLLLLALAPLTGGCAATQRARDGVADSFTSVSRSVGLTSEPLPASQVLCIFDGRMTSLPNPTKDGTKVSGITGQIYLLDAQSQSAPAAGSLAMMVYDETPRQGTNTQPHTPEMWHYTPEILAKMRARDDRLGPHYAVFLPWPAGWEDVTTVVIKTRYQHADEKAGVPDVYAQDVKIPLNLTAASGVQVEGNGVNRATHMTHAALDTRSVPDPRKALAGLQAGGAAFPGSVPLTDAPSQQAQRPTGQTGPTSQAWADGPSTWPAATQNRPAVPQLPPATTPVPTSFPKADDRGMPTGFPAAAVTPPPPPSAFKGGANENTPFATPGASAGPKPPSALSQMLAMPPAGGAGAQPIIIR